MKALPSLSLKDQGEEIVLVEAAERRKGHEEGKQDGSRNSLASPLLPSNLFPALDREVRWGKNTGTGVQSEEK